MEASPGINFISMDGLPVEDRANLNCILYGAENNCVVQQNGAMEPRCVNSSLNANARTFVPRQVQQPAASELAQRPPHGNNHLEMNSHLQNLPDPRSVMGPNLHIGHNMHMPNIHNNHFMPAEYLPYGPPPPLPFNPVVFMQQRSIQHNPMLLQQGQLHPGQLPHGQLHPGQLPHGQLHPGQLPHGQLHPGQLPHGQLHPGQLPHGQLHPGQLPHGQLHPGQLPQGQLPLAQQPLNHNHPPPRPATEVNPPPRSNNGQFKQNGGNQTNRDIPPRYQRKYDRHGGYGEMNVRPNSRHTDNKRVTVLQNPNNRRQNGETKRAPRFYRSQDNNSNYRSHGRGDDSRYYASKFEEDINSNMLRLQNGLQPKYGDAYPPSDVSVDTNYHSGTVTPNGINFSSDYSSPHSRSLSPASSFNGEIKPAPLVAFNQTPVYPRLNHSSTIVANGPVDYQASSLPLSAAEIHRVEVHDVSSDSMTVSSDSPAVIDHAEVRDGSNDSVALSISSTSCEVIQVSEVDGTDVMNNGSNEEFVGSNSIPSIDTDQKFPDLLNRNGESSELSAEHLHSENELNNVVCAVRGSAREQTSSSVDDVTPDDVTESDDVAISKLCREELIITDPGVRVDKSSEQGASPSPDNAHRSESQLRKSDDPVNSMSVRRDIASSSLRRHELDAASPPTVTVNVPPQKENDDTSVSPVTRCPLIQPSVAPETKPPVQSPKPSWAQLVQSNLPTPLTQNTSAANNDVKSKIINIKNEKTCQLEFDSSEITSDKLIRKFQFYIKTVTLYHRPPSVYPRGLINKGNWCYVNATLQALLACPPFYNLFKNMPRMEADARGNSSTPVSDSIAEFVNEFTFMKPCRGRKIDPMAIQCGKPFEPLYIYSMLKKLKSTDSFKQGRQEDAEEFLSCVLNHLHEEFIAASGVNSSTEICPSDDADMSDDWEKVGRKKKTVITRSNDAPSSLIREIFCGQIRSVLRCSGARESATLEPFFILQLDIQGDAIQSVKDALAGLASKESIQGFTCSKTKEEIEAVRCVMLEVLPSVLTLQLKCFVYDTDGGSKKLDKNIEYAVDLEICKDLISPNARSKIRDHQRSYKLFAVVYHCGRTVQGGHYITDVYHSGINGWVRIDDHNISVIPVSQVLKSDKYYMPYILFYRRHDSLGPDRAGSAPTKNSQHIN